MVRDKDQEATITQTRGEQAVFGARHRAARRRCSSQGSQGGRGLKLLDPALKRPRGSIETLPRRFILAECSLELLVPERDLDLAPRRPKYIHDYPIGYDSLP